MFVDIKNRMACVYAFIFFFSLITICYGATELIITSSGSIIDGSSSTAIVSSTAKTEDKDPATLSSISSKGAASKQEIVITAEKGQTIADAFKALTKDAKAGDTFILPDGVYSDMELLFSGIGTAQKPITFRAETPGRAIFTGKTRIVIKGKYLNVSGFTFDQDWYDAHCVLFSEAENCTLSDCVFIECGNKDKKYNHIVAIEKNSHYNSVVRCYMQGNLAMGMGVKLGTSLPDSTNNTFAYNYYKDIVKFVSNGLEPIQLGQGSDSVLINAYSTVEYCLFDNVNGDAEIISSKSSSNTFRYNTFKNSDGNVVLRGGNSSTVEGNYFLNVGLRVHGEKHKIINNYISDRGVGMDFWTGDALGAAARSYQGVKDCLIAYNTIVNTGEKGIYLGRNNGVTKDGYVYNVPPTDCVFQNNILVSDRGVLVEDQFSENISWINNIAWPSSSAKIGISESKVMKKDPALVKDNNGIWSITSKSAAVDSATPMAEILQDIGGEKRDKTKPDVGSKEYTAVTSPGEYSPLSPVDVGPTWMKGDVNNIVRINNPKPITY